MKSTKLPLTVSRPVRLGRFKSRRFQHGAIAMPEGLMSTAMYFAIIGIAFVGGSLIWSSIKQNSIGSDTVGLIRKIQSKSELTNDFTWVTPASLNQVGLANYGSFTWDGTNINDARGNAVKFDGAKGKLAILLGSYNADDCSAVAKTLGSLAYNINVGATAALTGTNAGTITGGSAYKAGDTVTQTNLNTGCGGASPKIAIEVR